MNKDLTVITAAERLWMCRQDKGLTQAWLADYLGVCLTYYQEAERGQRKVPGMWLTRRVVRDWAPPANRWRLARRRSGLVMRQVTRMIGITKVWYLALERSGDQRVAAFWVTQGFHGSPRKTAET